MADNVSLKKERAIAALLVSRRIADAAKSAGISERQLYRWLDDPDFQDALAGAQRDAVQSTLRVLAELTGAAVKTLASVMSNTKTPPGVRVRAAEVVLSRFESLRDSVDYDARLAEVERALKVGVHHEQNTTCTR